MVVALLAPGLAAAVTSGGEGSDRDVEVSDDGAVERLSTVEVSDRLLVRWAPDVAVGPRQRRLAELAAAHGVGAGADEAGVSAVSARVDAVALPGADMDAAIAQVLGWADVELAQPDAVVTATPAVAVTATPAMAVTATPVPATTSTDPSPPNDPLFAQQWGHHNLGEPVGPDVTKRSARAGFDSRVLGAWEATTGAPDVTVAVIDTAVDTSHPDLAGVVAEELDLTEGTGGSRLHGTGVTSVIAARADDGFGMAGVAPDIQVHVIGVFSGQGDDPGTSTLSAVTRGFEEATALGADVINASWVSAGDHPILRAAVEDAGVPVVAASGNDGRELTEDSAVHPAVYDAPNLITVTAVGPDGTVPSFANVGAEVVDIAAPGLAIIGAARDGEHAWFDGTSFAAPYVSGALALARTVAPYADTGDLIDAARWTSRAEPGLVRLTNTGGMLDVDALVRGIQRPICRPDLLPATDFADVSAGNGHRSGIDCVVLLQVMRGRGDGTFDPSSEVTRAQVASVLAAVVERLQPGLADPPPAGFIDVTDTNVHAHGIDRLADLGIVTGREDGRFLPDAPVTRGQLAALLVRTYQLTVGGDVTPSRTWFDDIEGTTHAASISRARDLGLVRGVSRLSFAPEVGARRDQVASLFAAQLDALAREGAWL